MLRKLFMLCLCSFIMFRVTAQDNAAKAIELAELQLKGYNARNIDLFLQAYSDTVKVYNFPNQFQYQGIETMRKNYGRMFNETKDLHCHLVNRTASGNIVIDHERVTRSKDQPPVEVFALYKIKGGKIIEVHFIRPEQSK
jgi:hypothetical protein